MSDKDIAAFRTLCERWQRNKEALGFYAHVVKKGVKINVDVVDYPPEFEKSVNELARQIVAKGIQYISSRLIFSVDPNDRDDQLNQTEHKLHEILAPLLNYLVEYGFEAFDLQVRNHVSVIQMEYELSHLRFDNGQWIRWTGEIWNGRSWIGRKSNSADSIAKILGDFMESQFIVV